MAGLPDEAFDTLARLLSRICDNPYERLLSVAVTGDGRRSTASCTVRASCTDDPGNYTNGTHRAGIIWRTGP
jgi:hypothetical protein